MEIPISAGAPSRSYIPSGSPGEHGPTGPVLNLGGVAITAARQARRVARDLEDMFAIHCDAPIAAGQLEVRFDYLSPSGTEGFTATAIGSSKLAVINWNLVLLYLKGKTAADQMYKASLQLPEGWKFGTTRWKSSGNRIKPSHFKPVSLSMLSRFACRDRRILPRREPDAEQEAGTSHRRCGGQPGGPGDS